MCFKIDVNKKTGQTLNFKFGCEVVTVPSICCGGLWLIYSYNSIPFLGNLNQISFLCSLVFASRFYRDHYRVTDDVYVATYTMAKHCLVQFPSFSFCFG